jgi:mannosyltransferase OCH1-like enzyme
MIPKIIHQIWEGRKDPIPEQYKQFASTWKENHPDWRYEHWDGDKIDAFLKNNYPELMDFYYNLKYDVQRWDAIRYLILYKIGGLYADFDYECLEPFDDVIIDDDKCFFSMEPEWHCINIFHNKQDTFNNALMISRPGHPFMKKIIDHIFIEANYVYGNIKMKGRDVFSTTGPVMLNVLYHDYPNKHEIALLPPELVSPWSKPEVQQYIHCIADEALLEAKLEKAIAIHYFFGLWSTTIE